MKLSRRTLLIAGGAATVPLGALGVGLASADTEAAAALPTTGVVPKELAGFDTAMQTYLQERSITSAQLAVAKGGKLLLARGYGKTTIEPTALFRIASLSKHITVAAIMTLVQDGELDLDTPVTSILGLSDSVDPRLSQASVRRLMQHLGGWDRDASGDQLWSDHTISKALGTPLPVSHDDIIEYATGRKLDFAPGSKMVYSNYGYLLLGRIIEKLSGTGYEDYVKTRILTPVGITRMRLGLSLKSEAAPTEVGYESKYTNTTVMDTSGSVVPYPYGGFNMPNQDANGGWLSSAVDLLRLARIFDAPGTVLNKDSLTTVFAVPETGVTSGGSWYGGGWYVRKSGSGINTWHTGGMPGTFSFLARLNTGVSYCAIFNRRAEEGTPEFGSIDPVLGKAAGAVTTWPTTDLFPKYF